MTTDSFDASAFDMGNTQSLNALSMDFQSKPPGFDESWATLDTTCRMGQALPVRNFDGFVSQGNYMHSHVPAYIGLETSTTMPWCHSASSTAAYVPFDHQISMSGMEVDPTVPMHSMWTLQVPQVQNVGESTIVPQEALLEGEYVRVDTPDLGMESYDDMDAPLPPSPQQVVFKHESSPPWVKPEPDSSDDDMRLRRSICETRTGGKSVKKERRGGSVCKRKNKAKNPQFVARWADGERTFRENVLEQDPGTGKYRWADQQPRKKFICQWPYDDDDETLPEDAKICGKLFQRPEHRQRHRKTHSADKDFPCLLCDKNFNRNDNCWAHGFTHVHRPGKKDGRNLKYSLRQVISVLTDPKHIDKLLNDWKKEVGSEYIPEDDEDDVPEFMEAVRKWNPDRTFQYDADEAVEKIRSHRM